MKIIVHLLLIYICVVYAGFQPFDTSAFSGPTVTHPTPPSAAYWSSTTGIKPTNAWFENLVLNPQNPFYCTPYFFTPSLSGLAFSYSGPNTTSSSASIPNIVNFQFSATQTFLNYKVTAYDDVSVTLTFTSSSGTMVAYLVQGSPFVTVSYNNVTPLINTGTINIIDTLNGLAVNASSLTPAAGSRYFITTVPVQDWVLYSLNSNISITLLPSSISLNSPPTSSLLRLGIAAGPSDLNQLDNTSATYPTGGSIDVSVTSQGMGQFIYTYNVVGPGNVAILALSHLWPYITSPASASIISAGYLTATGPTQTILAKSFTIQFPLTNMSFQPPRAVDSDKVNTVIQALMADSSNIGPAPSDVYGAGQAFARIARLILIAQNLSQQPIQQNLTSVLQNQLQPWLNGTNNDPFEYDSSWGGLVTTNGLVTIANDNGNGYYYGHHIQYGYFIYAAAVIALVDNTWATTYNTQVLQLIRDIANPSSSDPYYPKFRDFDFFAGHSWSLGLATGTTGRSQISSSEAVNAYYAIALYGSATSNQNVMQVGQILASAEIIGAKKYYQMTTKDVPQIYSTPFANNKVVGVIYSTEVDLATPSNSGIEYSFTDQTFPVTPITEQVITSYWVSESYAVLSTVVNSAAQANQGYAYIILAVTNKTSAWTQVQTLTSFETKNSRTNTYFWVATRPSSSIESAGSAISLNILVMLFCVVLALLI